MTDEELGKKAYEYADGMAMYYESTHDTIPSQLEKYLRNAYIAGAKENAVVWHNIRKNPLDLPPARRVVFISGYLGDMKGLHGLDEWDGEKWTNTDMPGLVRVAWCDTPEFEEE